jgi:hypothetical protein
MRLSGLSRRFTIALDKSSAGSNAAARLPASDAGSAIHLQRNRVQIPAITYKPAFEPWRML